MSDRERRLWRRWFLAAAIYNLVWGVVACAVPELILRLARMPSPESTPFIQGLGMMVGVYAYGYYLLAREPIRYQGMIWIGLAGKTLGPIGFLFCALSGDLPWSFFWVTLPNDLFWWPAFWIFALRYARHPLDG